MRIFMLQSPFRRRKADRVGELYELPRNTDLLTNLTEYRAYYAEILAERPAEALLPDADQRQRTLDAYYRYIEAQLADAEAKILQLRALRAATGDRGGR